MECEHLAINNTTGKCLRCGINIDALYRVKQTDKAYKESQIISITSTDGTKHEFVEPSINKFGFICKLLEVKDEFIIGYVLSSPNAIPEPTMWRTNGSNQHSAYNLTPVPKPWYNNLDNFPVLITNKLSNIPYKVVYDKSTFIANEQNGYTLSTKSDRDSLYIQAN